MRNFLNISIAFTSVLILIFIFALTSRAGIIGPKPALTKDQAKVLLANDLRDAANNLFSHIKGSLMMQSGKIWLNKDGLTPQEAFQALGPNQCDARQKYLFMASFVNSIVADSVPAEPRQVSEDGSGDSCVVTVRE